MATGKKITPEEYEQWLTEHRPDVTARDPYAGAHRQITHICDRGHDWITSPHNVKQGRKCAHCGAEDRGVSLAGSWTLESCKEDALKYQTRYEWIRASGGAIKAARRNGWYEECCAHMIEVVKPRGYWNRQRCMEDAKRFSSIVEWQNASWAAYSAASKKGWRDDCVAHMERRTKPNGWYDDKENWPAVIADAQQYETAGLWYQGSGTIYSSAVLRPELYALCTEHMEQASGGSDCDAVYVYEIGDALGWTGLYKTGLTSWRKGDWRIKFSNQKNGTDYRIVALIRTTKGDAPKIEKAILDSGEPFTDLPDTFVDGRTEVRRFGPVAMETINQLAVMSGYKEAA